MTSIEQPTISEMLDIKSVAIIGVSGGMGYYWPHSMLQWPHDLKVWLVSRSGGEVLGHPIYKSLAEVPEQIDYAIIRVPYTAVPEVLKEVSKKGAKGATIFTSGFSELGNEEGFGRQKELKEIVDRVPTRVFGPNCMGLTYPKLGFAFMPTVERRIGDVGFLSQSGGVAISTYTLGVESGVGFSKVFSFGNAIDITPAELLHYFKEDDETAIVGAYIEGTKQGRDLLESLKSVAEKKPTVVLKGGRSEEGARAVSSHTGALAGTNAIWDAAFKQANVQTVKTLEEMIATLSIFSLSPRPQSKKTGIVAISGGTSVIYTDLAIEIGLEIPGTSPETIVQLDPLIKDVGTSLGNPIDLAADYYNFTGLGDIIKIIGSDQSFDSIILEADVHYVHQVASIMNMQDDLGLFWNTMAEAGQYIVKEIGKPVLVAVPEVAYPEPRAEAWRQFVHYGLPVFRNMTEAITALEKVASYYETRDSRSQTA
jgi:acetyltransferase